MKIKEIVDIQGYDKRARLMDLYTQGMDLLAGTEAWEEVQKEIHQLRKELGMNEGDYFSHDDPEYSDWHKFARLQDLYDLVDDGGNYDKEEVEAEVKWLRKELDMHASERRGVAADSYKKGWSPHGHNARLENINEECGEGEYYCRKSGMCKPIPDGYKVTDDGTLINERLIGPTRMAVQKYFDNEAYGLRRARIDATEKALKISNMDVDSKGIVQDFKYEFGEIDEVATAGSTSAGNIAAVNNPHVTNPYRKGKKKHPKPVSVSALDDKTSSIFGGPLRRL